MDPRLFVLICLAAASRHQPSSVLEVDPNDPQDHAFNKADFQRLRDEVNSSDKGIYDKSDIGRAKVWPSFLKAHPEEGWRLFKKLAAGKYEDVRRGAAESPAWPTLLETHNAEAWQLFQKLAQDKAQVREKAAKSPAWPMLLETQHAEACQLFEKLATDKDDVRRGAAESPAWPDLIQSNLLQSLQIFAELMDALSLYDVVSLPVWKAFGKVPPTAFAERDSQELQDAARWLQKVADHGDSHEIKGLPLFDGFSTHLQRSTNETWLGEMVKLPLFAGNAAERLSPAENVYLDCLSEFWNGRRGAKFEGLTHFQFNLWILMGFLEVLAEKERHVKVGCPATHKVSGLIELMKEREKDAIDAKEELIQPATVQPWPRRDGFFARDHSKRF